MIISKKFSDVRIGDKAFQCVNPTDFAGRVLAKGNFEELSKKYNSVASKEDMLEFFSEEELKNSECVAIEQNPSETLEGYTNLIYMYDYDPSSVYVPE